MEMGFNNPRAGQQDLRTATGRLQNSQMATVLEEGPSGADAAPGRPIPAIHQSLADSLKAAKVPAFNTAETPAGMQRKCHKDYESSCSWACCTQCTCQLCLLI